MDAQQDQTGGRKRDWRSLIPIFIPILVITILVTAESIINNSPLLRSASWYTATLSFAIVNVNIILILVLLVVIFRHLVKLFGERKRKILGARFRTKLVLTMIAIILVPTVLVYLISSDLIAKSIASWYEKPVENIVRSSENLARIYPDDYESLLTQLTTRMAEYISRENLLNDDKVMFLRQRYVEPLMDMLPLDIAEIYKGERLFDAAVVNPESPLLAELEPTSRQQVKDLLEREQRETLTPVIWREDLPGGTLIRCAAPIPGNTVDRRSGRAVGFVIVGVMVQKQLALLAEAISSDYQRYRETMDGRSEVNFASQGLLLIFTLISLFSAIWIGIFISRGITVPIQRLAEGTRAVAGGNLDFRVDVESTDELGILVASFNEMTKDLKQSKSELEEANRNLLDTNQELERRRRYTETLLSNLSAGVVSLDDSGRISTVNATAAALLNLPVVGIAGTDWHEVFGREDLAPLGALCERFFESGVQSLSEQINLRLDQQLLHLSANLTAIRQEDGSLRGTLVVLDDLTQLIRAQRTAAWREVAQRIAHEIKNPLTPIQLSAERIRRRLLTAESRAGGNGDEVTHHENLDLIATCTETIIEETGTLKSMVDSFSTFARMPPVHLSPNDLNAVLERATSIYTTDPEGNGLVIDMKLSPGLPMLDLDPEQLKMAFVNIINNAVDAMEGKGRLRIITRMDTIQSAVIIDFADSGPGIPPETKDKLFLPYFSTKKKGTGLGLAIVSRVIQDHHGTITISDNVPHGAIFTITLPAV